VPQLSSGTFDFGRAARTGGAKVGGGGRVVPRSSTSSDLFSAPGTRMGTSRTAGRRQSEQRGHVGGTVSWTTTAPTDPGASAPANLHAPLRS